MDVSQILIPISLMAGLGVILSLLLSLANQKLYVYEDPKIEKVGALLPQTNCGACGEPGCRAFAEALVKESRAPNECTVSSGQQIEVIAGFLGVSLVERDRLTARLACAGGNNVARQSIVYGGFSSCRSAALVSGGGKGCAWGCLGLGDCEKHCEFGAIRMDEHSLPVVDADLCTACNDCVEVCPKDLFELVPVKNHLWVACKNRLADEDATRDCEVACTGCGLCAADASPDLIRIVDNLAIIDFSNITSERKDAIDRCPTGAIVWMDKNQIRKGLKAKKILRTKPLTILNS